MRPFVLAISIVASFSQKLPICIARPSIGKSNYQGFRVLVGVGATIPESLFLSNSGLHPYSTVLLKFNSKKQFFRITSKFLLFLN